MRMGGKQKVIVNGKEYPLWSQFIERKAEWIGGILEDFGDAIDRSLGAQKIQTEITDIRLEPNGKDSAFFSVDGKDFSCGFDVSVGGVIGGEDGWLTFSGYGGYKWRIRNDV